MQNSVPILVQSLILRSHAVVGTQSLFTAILRPTSEEPQRSDKSLIQLEREMLTSLPVPAVMTDERGLIQGFNAVRYSFFHSALILAYLLQSILVSTQAQAAEVMFGRKLTEVVGRNVKMLMPNPDRDRHDGYLERYLQTGKQRVFGLGRDLTGMHKDGSIVPVRLSVSEKKDGNKRIWVAIVQKLN